MAPTFPSLTCPDCSHAYSDQYKPLLLPCGHSACKTCLGKREDDGRQNCAKCNKCWEDTNLSDLPVVYQLSTQEGIPTGAEVVDGAGVPSGVEVVTSHGTSSGREVPTSPRLSQPSGRETSSSSQAGGFPACEICLEDYNNLDQKPSLLPCGHVFCTLCLDELKDSGNCCPKCRKPMGDTYTTDLPVVKDLIHPNNENKKNERRRTAGGTERRRLSRDEILERASRLSPNSTLKTAQSRNPGKIEVYVKDINNKTANIIISLNERVETLRLRIRDELGVQPQHQMLIYGGRRLEDGKTLAFYNITNFQTIHLTCRQAGG